MQLSLPLREEPWPHPSGARTEPPADAPVLFVRRRHARRYVLRVGADGVIRVTIPRGGSRREAEAFVDRHRVWIARQRARERPPGVPAAQRIALRERAAAELPDRLRAMASRLGLQVERITIGDQRTRWGSCGRNGHIALNWRLLLMPEWVADYVLVHELMHLRRLDHSAAYWALVAEACPTYRDARRWLRHHAAQLL
jgi:predicted metal-dependent hydrolase